jgi:hypothetical protein
MQSADSELFLIVFLFGGAFLSLAFTYRDIPQIRSCLHASLRTIVYSLRRGTWQSRFFALSSSRTSSIHSLFHTFSLSSLFCFPRPNLLYQDLCSFFPVIEEPSLLLLAFKNLKYCKIETCSYMRAYIYTYIHTYIHTRTCMHTYMYTYVQLLLYLNLAFKTLLTRIPNVLYIIPKE